MAYHPFHQARRFIKDNHHHPRFILTNIARIDRYVHYLVTVTEFAVTLCHVMNHDLSSRCLVNMLFNLQLVYSHQHNVVNLSIRPATGV